MTICYVRSAKELHYPDRGLLLILFGSFKSEKILLLIRQRTENKRIHISGGSAKYASLLSYILQNY